MPRPRETALHPRTIPAQSVAIMARPIIIDCDPGTDDAIALFLALGNPALDVRLVTVAGGNVGLAHTMRNARALVASGAAILEPDPRAAGSRSARLAFDPATLHSMKAAIAGSRSRFDPVAARDRVLALLPA